MPRNELRTMTRYRTDSHVSTNDHCEGYHSAFNKDWRGHRIITERVERVVHIIIQKVHSRLIHCTSKQEDSHRFALLKETSQWKHPTNTKA